MLKGIFFCDVDGTILPHGDEAVSQRFFDAVRTAYHNDFLVCISSGRIFCSLHPLFVEIEDLVVFSACNGCMIIHNDTELIPNHTIEYKVAKEIVANLHRWGAIALIATTEGLYLSDGANHHQRSLHYLHKPTTQTFNSFAEIDAPILQVTALCDSNIDHVIALSRAAWEGEYYITTTGYEMFDICPTTKGESLSLIAEHFSIDRSRTWAFGDNENDLAMLDAAGKGYLMQNAHHRLHNTGFELCGDVTETLLAIIKDEQQKSFVALDTMVR